MGDAKTWSEWRTWLRDTVRQWRTMSYEDESAVLDAAAAFIETAIATAVRAERARCALIVRSGEVARDRDPYGGHDGFATLLLAADDIERIGEPVVTNHGGCSFGCPEGGAHFDGDAPEPICPLVVRARSSSPGGGGA